MPLVPLSRAPQERKSIDTPTWALWWTSLVKAVNDLLGRTQTGDGSPETIVTAPVGTLYLDVNGGAGTTLYVKESGAGNVGWIPK